MRNLSAVLWTIAAVLFLLWVIGFVAQLTFGGLLHLLLVLVVLAVVIDIVRSMRA
ncbi:MAG: lmo0937 family membrane protein [Planctomycetes bacterium]|nr:lmo0937 family membrane protein [Planctomycetota bacterium]